MTDGQTGFVFDKRQTNIAKGVAILLLLWHHLFYNTPKNYGSFITLFSVKGIPVECFIAQSGKVCVAVFLFLSGYGLYKSYGKVYNTKICFASLKVDFLFVKKHLIKLLMDYWIVFIVFVPLGFLANRNPIEVYNGNIVFFLIDILGLSNLINTPTMNPTWWFMSLIIVLYFLYPLLHRITDYSAELFLIVSYLLCVCYILPDLTNLRIYLFPFALGMYFSKYEIFSKASQMINTWVKRVLIVLSFLFITLWLKYLVFINGAEIEGFLALAIIMSCFLVFSRIRLMSTILEHIGVLSGLIFMFHTFIFDYYLHDFIYGFKFSLLIFVVFLIICLIIAKILDLSKKLFRIENLNKKC